MIYHTVTTYHTVALASTTVLPRPTENCLPPFTRVGLGSHPHRARTVRADLIAYPQNFITMQQVRTDHAVYPVSLLLFAAARTVRAEVVYSILIY